MYTPNCEFGMLASADPPFMRDVGDDPVEVVRAERVGVVARAGVERDEETRLADEVHAGLEVVAEAAHTGDVPGEVVTELLLLLLRLLRRVGVLPD